MFLCSQLLLSNPVCPLHSETNDNFCSFRFHEKSTVRRGRKQDTGQDPWRPFLLLNCLGFGFGPRRIFFSVQLPHMYGPIKWRLGALVANAAVVNIK